MCLNPAAQGRHKLFPQTLFEGLGGQREKSVSIPDRDLYDDDVYDIDVYEDEKRWLCL